MNIEQAFHRTGIERLDAEVLLAHILGHDRTWILAHGEQELPDKDYAAYIASVERRRNNEPVAYITGEKEFYGRMFHVTPDVLIPRPATEGLVAFVLDTLHHHSNERVRAVDAGIVAVSSLWAALGDVQTIVDIGTGSGCIAVTLACEHPVLHVVACDVSQRALAVAQQNALYRGVADRIDFRRGHLLQPLHDYSEPFVVVSNPPYIPENEELQPDVERYEPSLALRAGLEGMEITQALLQQAHAHPQCRGVFIECREEQVHLITNHEP